MLGDGILNKQTEALKMAIEALQNVYFENEQLSFVDNAESNWKQRQKALKACKEALEQPVCIKCGKPTQQGECFYGCRQEQPAQEPVAWMDKNKKAVYYHKQGINFYIENAIPLYTHPAPSWQKLSDEEITECNRKAIANTDWGLDKLTFDFARIIEQALKEKNT